jgi:hypothetical protein
VKLLVVALLTISPLTWGACDSREQRQFDFWLGEWNVHTPDGKLAGVNRITLEYDGCVLHEHYSNNRGFSGESLNVYDAARKVWHQTWVDNSGLLLLIEGGFRDGNMVLEGQVIDAAGLAVRHRITWSPNADGSVRQHWESTDATGKWTTLFDGKYTRK